MTDDPRFTQPLYTVADAARLVGMHPATLTAWAHGYRRKFPDRRPVEQDPVITAMRTLGGPSVPFVGLVEATVVQAFRSTGLPLQRVRRALEALRNQRELEHALASRRLYTDGAQVLYDYARQEAEPQLRLLTVVVSGQRVFHEVIAEYLERIDFNGDRWATGLIVPATEREILRIRPEIAHGDPLFMAGGAPLSAVASRWKAGEPASSIADDYGVPVADIQEAVDALVTPVAA